MPAIRLQLGSAFIVHSLILEASLPTLQGPLRRLVISRVEKRAR